MLEHNSEMPMREISINYGKSLFSSLKRNARERVLENG